MTQVKICGIRQVEHGLAAAEAGATMLGFVFAPSRRRIEPEAAQNIVLAVRERFPAVRMVGLFVDEYVEEMERVATLCDLDLIQLSGSEPDEVVSRLPIPVIRTIHVFPETTRADLWERIPTTPGHMVLLDTGAAGSFGGTGQRFDWTIVRNRLAGVPASDRPVLLAGGLTPDNVGEAILTARPWGVDVSSGVERDGIKDIRLIQAFIEAASKMYAV